MLCVIEYHLELCLWDSISLSLVTDISPFDLQVKQ